MYTICIFSKHRQIVKGSPRRIKRLRLELGVSQARLADKLGVATNTVARWERGDLKPPKVVDLAVECLLLKSGQQ